MSLKHFEQEIEKWKQEILAKERLWLDENGFPADAFVLGCGVLIVNKTK